VGISHNSWRIGHSEAADGISWSRNLGEGETTTGDFDWLGLPTDSAEIQENQEK
jgi:hypothetical protein